MFNSMFYRFLIFLAFFNAAGCVAQTPHTPAADEPEEIVNSPKRSTQPADDFPDMSDAERWAPDACEVLLQALSHTAPLLDNLNESLADQTQQIDQAIERLNQPPVTTQAPACPPVARMEPGRKESIGAIEWIYMDPPGRHFRARIDSGAETSSLSASEVREFERDGKDWVRFTFEHDNKDDLVKLELPIKRTVLIRQVSTDEPERRVVVELGIRLGQQLQETEFTLTDRSRMTFPVLLGRAFLMDLYVIDVSRSYTHPKFESP